MKTMVLNQVGGEFLYLEEMVLLEVKLYGG